MIDLVKHNFKVGDRVTWINADPNENDIIIRIEGDELWFADGCYTLASNATLVPDVETLRDQFAGLAMQVYIKQGYYETVPEKAYQMADMMLEWRNRTT